MIVTGSAFSISIHAAESRSQALGQWLQLAATVYSPGRWLIAVCQRFHKRNDVCFLTGGQAEIAEFVGVDVHRNFGRCPRCDVAGKSSSARLTWESRDHLTLTHHDYDTVGATIAVPVATEGEPPEIAYDPKYLANALEIGLTRRLVDKLNPGMATSSSGNFCVQMSQRFTEETEKVETASETPDHAMAA